MSCAGLDILLKQVMGLDTASLGSQAVERAVQARMAACATQDLAAYTAQVRTSREETQALIEAMVVPETWFFRDQEAFAALVRIVQEEWLPAHAQGTLRLLSLPCSSGEEPYSMAMALLDAGVPAGRFRIDALDISVRSLTRARHAHYGNNSFRGAELGYRERHFDAMANGHQLHQRVREQVTFAQANLLDAALLARTQNYDIIFCRNLLIYFDGATQQQAIKVLQDLLAERGVLFVGPSETGLLLNQDFVSIRVPLAFAFRASASPAFVAPVSALAPAPVAAAALVDGAAATLQAASATELETQSVHDIEAARRLADQGKLEQALKCCEEHIVRYGPSTQAFHLLGLIHVASSKLPEAYQFYRKALYLDPNHYDTLIHLALLLEERGSRADATVLRARISRLQQLPASAHAP